MAATRAEGSWARVETTVDPAEATEDAAMVIEGDAAATTRDLISEDLVGNLILEEGSSGEEEAEATSQALLAAEVRVLLRSTMRVPNFQF